MNGKIVGGLIVLVAAVAGIAMYWLQEYAFYQPAVFQPGNEIKLTLIESGLPEPILAEDVEGIDADSSPLRFRACFHTPLSQAMLTETYKIYADAVPLNGPSWFGCFDAAKIGEALEKGEAIAFLSQANIAPQIDRVVAVFPDGRAYAWHQLSADVEQ
ncbi:MAG: Uncharacterized protein FD162_1968 [Rhodobacteraceae bacterium]|nr:MAG: Uncharacterized protein FD162_1968 [Paracoccaceae bacterium]